MQYVVAVTLLFYMFFKGSQILSLIRVTRCGLIQGALVRSRSNSTIQYFSFKGIPYGRPPIGKLRFQEALPPTSWLGIKNTMEAALPCVQISNNFNGNDVIGSEDCLYLDVYEPKTTRYQYKKLLPVMIWLHGGTFIFGTTNTTGPDYLMEKPIVLVEVQYRLNVFGFLSTLDKYAKGNLGLKDQVLAFKWVQDNIAFFGGDPNQVTIFGESAGGASVLYHMLSPRSQGLFHKAISQSGSALNRWALQEHPLHMTLKLAQGLGIEETDSKITIEKLQKLDHRVIIRAAFNKHVVGFYTPYYVQPFAPIIESESDTAFISESSFSRLERGRYSNIPYITGFNTEEGSFAYSYVINGRADINIFKEHPELLIPISMNIFKESECYQLAINIIKGFYFKNGDLTDKVSWIKYMSQELFIRGIVKTMDLMYKSIPLYFYRFTYTGSRPMSQLGGVGHFEEVQYLFYPTRPGANTVESESDRLTRTRLVTMWTNFAATGNPTPHEDELLQYIVWPKANPNNAFLDFGSNLTVLENSNEEDFQFWEYLFNLCGNPPYVTY